MNQDWTVPDIEDRIFAEELIQQGYSPQEAAHLAGLDAGTIDDVVAITEDNRTFKEMIDQIPTEREREDWSMVHWVQTPRGWRLADANGQIKT